MAFVVLAQLALTAVTRRRDIAAVVILLAILLLAESPALYAVVVINIGIIIFWLWRRHFPKPRWPDITRAGNLIGGLMLIIAVVQVLSSGPYRPSGLGPRPVGATEAPDVFLILLDGHPRLDTLRNHFAVDTGPFLDAMAAQGFVESSAAHANYNLTFLTLASMFNGQQIDDLVPDKLVSGGLGVLSHLINDGDEIDRFRDVGYEIVSVPSPFSRAALERADRFLDSGHVTDFEHSLLRTGLVKRILPDVQRAWLMDDNRQRVLSTLDRLDELAVEQVDHPRFVFAHILAPHPPVAFALDGAPVEGLACFPVNCTLWNGGENEPPSHVAAQAAQIEWIDAQILRTVTRIQKQAVRPPVVVVFSDHGHRYDLSDPEEGLRSLLLASTPGHSGMFPADASPVNLLTRLSNAYLGSSIPLASEESYFLDIAKLEQTGAFAYQPVP